MIKKIFVSLVVFAAVMAGGFYFFTIQNLRPHSEEKPTTTPALIKTTLTATTTPKVLTIKEQLAQCLPFSDMQSKQKCDALIASITNFDECIAAGFENKTTVPPSCFLPDGRTLYSSVPVTTTLSGLYLCLPVRDTNAPRNDICALGLMTDNGKYYALDTSALSRNIMYATGDQLRVTGLLTPAEQLNTNYWQQYNISGIMKVSEVAEIE